MSCFNTIFSAILKFVFYFLSLHLKTSKVVKQLFEYVNQQLKEFTSKVKQS